MSAKYEMQVFETPQKLSEAACHFIVDLAKRSIEEKDRFVIALSGGHTPEMLYALLSEARFSGQINWTKTFIFWGDERCVPFDDERNNAHSAKALLLDKVKLPAANIFRIPVDLPPAQAAERYERTLKAFFGYEPSRFDLVLLGLGENGHTASLFPGSDVLQEQQRWVKEVYIEEQKMYRVTLTAHLINQSHNILFLVAGDAKSKILRTVLKGPHLPDEYPAQLIRPVDGRLSWMVDRAAASQMAFKGDVLKNGG